MWLRQADYDSALKVAGFENCSIVYDMRVKRYAPESSDHRQVVREFSECLNRAGTRFVVPPWWKIIVTDALSVGALWLLTGIIVVVGRRVAAG